MIGERKLFDKCLEFAKNWPEKKEFLNVITSTKLIFLEKKMLHCLGDNADKLFHVFFFPISI